MNENDKILNHLDSIAVIADPDIDYRAEMFAKYDQELLQIRADDSYISEEDRHLLFKYCHNIVTKQYSAFPNPMNEILLTTMYDNIVKGMDKEEYLQEKEKLSQVSFIDKELGKLDKFNGV